MKRNKILKKGFFKRALFLFPVILFSEPSLISPDFNFAGSFDFINPSRQSVEYDYLRLGAINRFMQKDMTIILAQGNYHIQEFSVSGAMAYEPNKVLERFSSGLGGSYYGKNISAGVFMLGVSNSYSDNVKDFSYRVFLSSSVYSENFFCSASYGFSDQEAFYCAQAGYQKKGMKAYIQGAVENKFVLSGVMSFSFNDDFAAGFSSDTEKRFLFCVESRRLPYVVEYSGMVHPYLPVSSGVFIKIIKGNSNLKLENIRISAPKPEYEKGRKIIIKSETPFPINLNKASYEEILQMKDVSRNLLRRIYADRLINGDFEDYSRIDKMHGAGKVTLERIINQTYIGEAHGEEEEQ